MIYHRIWYLSQIKIRICCESDDEWRHVIHIHIDTNQDHYNRANICQSIRCNTTLPCTFLECNELWLTRSVWHMARWAAMAMWSSSLARSLTQLYASSVSMLALTRLTSSTITYRDMDIEINPCFFISSAIIPIFLLLYVNREH